MTNEANIVGIEEHNILERMAINEVKTYQIDSYEGRQVRKLLPRYRYRLPTFITFKQHNLITVVRLENKPINDNYDMQLFDCSMNAVKYLEGKRLSGTLNEVEPMAAKFPLHKMLVGQSFALPLIGKFKRCTIQNEINKYTSENKTKFKIVEHSKLSLFEIVRTA
jgi:hypothetical protein